MKITRSKIFALVVAVVIIILASVAIYLYQQGSTEHYKPPKESEVSPDQQAAADLMTISKAVEAYNSLNLKYPEKLEELVPDFLARVPAEPGSGRAYVYKTDGTSNYTVEIADPAVFKLKKMLVENGKFIKE